MDKSELVPVLRWTGETVKTETGLAVVSKMFKKYEMKHEAFGKSLKIVEIKRRVTSLNDLHRLTESFLLNTPEQILVTYGVYMRDDIDGFKNYSFQGGNAICVYFGKDVL